MAANTTKCTLSMTFSHGSSSEHHSKSKRASGTPSIANRLWLRLMLPRSCEDSFASTCIFVLSLLPANAAAIDWHTYAGCELGLVVRKQRWLQHVGLRVLRKSTEVMTKTTARMDCELVLQQGPCGLHVYIAARGDPSLQPACRPTVSKDSPPPPFNGLERWTWLSSSKVAKRKPGITNSFPYSSAMASQCFAPSRPSLLGCPTKARP